MTLGQEYPHLMEGLSYIRKRGTSLIRMISSINNGYAHNYFLQILASQGIIGMFLVIVRYAIIISNLIRNKKDLFSRASLASVVMVFINSMYEPCIGEFCFNMIYWFIIGIGLARCYEDILDTTE